MCPARPQRKWILSIEDNEDELLFVRGILDKTLYPVTWAKDASEAEERLKDAVFSLILVGRGFSDLIEELKIAHPRIPVVAMVECRDRSMAAAHLRATVQSIAEKPVGAPAPAADGAPVFLETIQGFDHPRGFKKTLEMEIARSRRYMRTFTILHLDVGDEEIGAISTAIRSCCRAVDRPARTGSHEFAVLCPEIGPDDTARLLDQFGEALPSSVAIGIASYPQDGADAKALMAAATESLHRKKRAIKRARLPRFDEPLYSVASPEAKGGL